MAITVTVRMFSCRPNPVVTLSDPDEAGIRLTLSKLAGAPIVLPRYRIGGLGFRGFLLEPAPGTARTRELPGPTSVYGEVIDYGGTTPARHDIGRTLEYQIVALVLPRVMPDIQPVLRKEAQDLYADPNCQAGEVSGPGPLPGRPPYQPTPWNAAGVGFRNNCYNYANNRRFTAGFPAIPGKGGGQGTPFGTCAALKTAVKKDLLKAITRAQTTNTLNNGGGSVALFVKQDDTDCHFYRQDRSGKWSHKPGAWPARDCDEAGDAILDPSAADTLDYDFCGFFESHAGVLIA